MISGLDIPFGDLVAILIKLALASIPATVILLLIGTLFAAFLGAAIAGLVESFGAP